jgi:hypothetical protein
MMEILHRHHRVENQKWNKIGYSLIFTDLQREKQKNENRK